MHCSVHTYLDNTDSALVEFVIADSNINHDIAVDFTLQYMRTSADAITYPLHMDKTDHLLEIAVDNVTFSIWRWRYGYLKIFSEYVH